MSEMMKSYLPIIKKAKYQDGFSSFSMYLQMIQNFRGRTAARFTMNDAYFNEEECLQGMRERKYTMGITRYYLIKAEICCFYEDYGAAQNNMVEAEKIIQCLIGTPYFVKFCFLSFLSCAGRYPEMSLEGKNQARINMKKQSLQIKKWAEHCPVHFLHRQLIMEAEMAKIAGKFQLAGEIYDQAIKTAKNNEWFQHEALANELAARFYMQNGREKIAGVYMQEARYLYERWSADKGQFINDPCILKHRPKSGLCSPIVYHGRLMGMIYLENNLAI